MRDQAGPGGETGFTVARRFRVWRYSVSHRTLVLRSGAWSAGDHTVDAWFDGVVATSLHETFEPLTIRAAGPEERDRILAWSAGDIFDAVRHPPLCLVLASAQPDGFVVCAHARLQASLREPGPFSSARDPHPDTVHTLWSAGPSDDPAQRHEYRLSEAGRRREGVGPIGGDGPGGGGDGGHLAH